VETTPTCQDSASFRETQATTAVTYPSVIGLRLLQPLIRPLFQWRLWHQYQELQLLPLLQPLHQHQNVRATLYI